MKRNYGFDLLRIILCIFVIATHSYTYFGAEGVITAGLIPVYLIQADGLFYMLSGYFNLEKEFNSITDIKKFYKNKIIYILLPFLGFIFVWLIWDYVHVTGSFDFVEILGLFYESVMDTSADNHLWFMYPLFGLLLSTPFLSEMLHNMDKKELKLLWYIALGFNVIYYYLCKDIGVNFRVLAWIFDGWVIYYFAGYYYRHVVAEEKTIKWVILGIVGFAFTVFGMNGYIPFFKSFIGSTDIQPMFTIFCMSSLVLADKLFRINNEKIGKIILFLSKNTFLIYMFHMRGIEYALRKLSITNTSFVNGLLVILGSFIFSLIASVVTNFILKPIQKFLDKIWVVK